MALTGAAAQAKTITLDSTAYDGPSWAYVWDNTRTQWGYLQGTTSTSLTYSATNTPTDADPSYVGYSFAMVDGVQTLTSLDTTITVTAPTWIGAKGTYLSGGVTLTGNNNGFRGNSSIDFADITTSQLAYTGTFWKQGDVTVTGSLTLSSGESFAHTFFSASAMEQKSGIWDFSGFVITDADGNALTYTTDAEKIGKAGYFWVEESEFSMGSAYSATLKAMTVPEPATATLSLLALAGLATRRRRKQA